MTPDPWCRAPRHGTITAYSTDGCRCDAARAVMARYEIDRRQTGPRRIDATGTRRRIQALMAAGWSSTELGPLLFVHTSQVTKWLRLPQVSVKSAARVADLYDQLGLAEGPSPVTRARAARAGWASPIEWGEDIDDPGAYRLDLDWTPRGNNVPMDDIELLIRSGETYLGIQARTGVTPESLQRRLFRQGRHDLLTRLARLSECQDLNARRTA